MQNIENAFYVKMMDTYERIEKKIFTYVGLAKGEEIVLSTAGALGWLGIFFRGRWFVSVWGKRGLTTQGMDEMQIAV